MSLSGSRPPVGMADSVPQKGSRVVVTWGTGFMGRAC